MKEQLITVIANLAITLFLILGFVGVSLFFFEMQNVNNFRQTVNYQIERSGGLDSQVVADLNSHSEAFFNGRFVVRNQNQEVEFGELVNYQIDVNIPIPFIPVPNFEVAFTGTAPSMTR